MNELAQRSQKKIVAGAEEAQKAKCELVSISYNTLPMRHF
jgi:hypothetical protein